MARTALASALLTMVCAGPLSAQDQKWSIAFANSGSTGVSVACGDSVMVVGVAANGADLSKPVVQLGGKPVQAKLAGFDAVSRLCFFKPLKSEQKPAVWLSRAPDKTGVVLVAANKDGVAPGKSTGWVKRIGDKVLPLALMRLEFPLKVPVAGTPLFDESGRVAAIVFQKGDAENSVYAIPAEAVHRVLRDIRNGSGLVKGYLGISLRVENEKPRIVRVLPNSPAAEAGIREEDLIAIIAGQNISDYSDVANALFYVVPGEPLDITVRRGGQLLDFTLVPTPEALK